jgi:peptidoglycan/LPS O-acetylase OafA/YrhL
MSPLRWDVLGVSALFAAPVVLMYYRGQVTLDDLTGRVPWCLLAGWVVVAVLRAATRPPAPAPRRRTPPPAAVHPEDTPAP